MSCITSRDGHYRHKRPHRVDVTKLPGEPPVKVNKGPPAPVTEIDPTSSDHVVAMTQLKEKIASLTKQIQQKEAGLFSKDKQVCLFQLNACYFSYCRSQFVIDHRIEG